MFDGGTGMATAFNTLNINHPPLLLGGAHQNTSPCKSRSNLFVAVHKKKKNSSPRSKNLTSSGTSATSNSLLNQARTVGIIGGVSVFSTLIFLEKLVWLSLKNGAECPPFVVCSNPDLSVLLPRQQRLVSARSEWNFGPIIENLRSKRRILEQSGAHCIVIPCHFSHACLREISEGCVLPFLHVGDCVATELKEAGLKPLEAGSNVRIGVLGSHVTLTAGLYQDKLQSQGFEVVLPDKSTIEHILIPAMEALKRRDMEGAQILLRIAIQVLLVRAVNVVVLASDELQGLLPQGDPLLKKCIDPMDALARETIRWSKYTGRVHNSSCS